ncbi:LegC family aminotransferase [Eudoraea chungangensis]|uniref:LegC family aminotransferase n=1 Tax=Eudoraea chungangensis TaxID=1481905 RepID=UPI0023ED6DCA|nr:LegC family aminotransferase [Eudoraea chungangensis]
MFNSTISFIKEKFDQQAFIPLHEPCFAGNEKEYLLECIDSTFVSSVGKFVDQFEDKVAKFTKAKFAIATVNGTSALHTALLLSGVEKNDEVITQALTFIATCNAISYIGAHPVFVDVDKATLGLSAEKLEEFLSANTQVINGICINKLSKRKIKAVVPMHTFGFPAQMEELLAVCKRYSLPIIEDAAESLGSLYKGKHTGTMGLFGVFSFNGNKTITTGGGGMIVTDDLELAKKAKHLTTTAKIPHKWDFVHNQIGYNYRLPNVNAAIGCAQMEMLPKIIAKKRALAADYKEYFELQKVNFVTEQKESLANYWLNTLILNDVNERNSFLEETNAQGVMTRPIWKLMNHLPMFNKAQTDGLENSKWLEERVVNIPSSVKF